MLSNPRIYRAYFNTILYTVTSAVFTLLIGSITAYPLALAGFQGRKYVTILLVVSLFVMPGLIPTYLLIISLGLRDTMWSFVLPAAFNVWYIVIIRTNFQAIPDALLESARLDGANDLTVLSRIVLPVSKAILATIGMFAAVHMWGLFFEPMLYLVDERKLPAVDRAAQRAGQGYRGPAVRVARGRAGVLRQRMAGRFVAARPDHRHQDGDDHRHHRADHAGVPVRAAILPERPLIGSIKG